MSRTYANSVKESISSAPGTGTLTLTGAIAGYQTFAAATPALDGKTVSARIEAVDANKNLTGLWEESEGVYTASGTTLTRVTVLDGSSGPGVKVNFTGACNVALTLAADAITNPQAPDQAALDSSSNAANTKFVTTAIRQKLSGAFIYWVATTGSDSNNGLAIGTPFLTRQKAWNTMVSNLDLAGQTVTINLAAGTYTDAFSATGAWVGGGNVVFQGPAGDTTAIISTTSADCFNLSGFCMPGSVTLKNLKLKTTTGGYCINNQAVGTVFINNIAFDACAVFHIYTEQAGASVVASGNYSIIGSAQIHWVAQFGSVINVSNVTVTITGTPSFSFFAYGTRGGAIQAQSNTYSGSATGPRYFADTGGGIWTNGAGATALPGNSAGSVSAPGWYE